MAQDHLSYKRATSVSLIGLGIQIAVFVAFFVYARLGKDPAAMTGSLAVVFGVPVWVSLALVFHQHRLERLEALEAEAYRASSAAQASVFEETGADQNVQASKLAWMHKWFLPSVSLFVGVLLIGVGLLRFVIARNVAEDALTYNPPPESGWAIALGVGIAVVAFVFARFVAGMAKQQVWFLLHGGAAAAVNAALIGAVVAVAHFFSVAVGYDHIVRLLPNIFSIYMVALGAEVLLNFLLNLYKPRKPGEYLRPAFDSRILAFFAAPDRLAESISDAINYQFGFNVSGTWFYRLLSRSIVGLALLSLVILWGLSCFTIVRPYEQGLYFRNGKLVSTLDSGLHWKAPWPIGRVEKFPSLAVNEIQIGAGKPKPEGPILWTTAHGTNELQFLVQPTPTAGSEVSARRADFALLIAEIPIHFTISNLEHYLKLAQDGPRKDPDKMRQDLLRSIASSAVMEYMATNSVDQILGPHRPKMMEDIRTIVQAEFDRIDAGVNVLFAGIAGVHPSEDVAPSFENVVNADQRRIATIEQAEAEAIRTLASVAGDLEVANEVVEQLNELDALRNAKADEKLIAEKEQVILDLILQSGGEAATILSEARAKRWETHLSARARLAASQGQVAAYRAAPLPYKAQKYFDAIEDMAARARVYIVPPNVRVDMNYEEIEPSIGGLVPDSADGSQN